MAENVTDAFMRLVSIMDELREKCPWDQKQTIQTLRPLTIEELYELADAITEGDWKGIKEELGDLLLHILFYAKIGSEQKQFELVEVINGVSEKLISRHPHIYGDVKVKDEEDVKRNWELLKLKEGKKSVLSGVPKALPAIVKATRLQEKARKVGFEWDNKDQVWLKVEEEMQELKEAIGDKDKAADSYKSDNQPASDKDNYQEKIEEEFGDLLFSMVNYARFLHVDAENALERTNKKFIHRFTQMEQQAQKEGKTLDTMTLEEMDAIWNSIKQQRYD
jgi:XTP/dITP diphosphohydrolase